MSVELADLLEDLSDYGLAVFLELNVAVPTLDVLEFGTSPITSEELLERVQLALAEEIRLLLAEGVVDAPEDVDLCMITGAGWPLHLGGITPYLNRTGASERVNGRLFHPARGRATTAA